jgi:hypothetical protein
MHQENSKIFDFLPTFDTRGLCDPDRQFGLLIHGIDGFTLP